MTKISQRVQQLAPSATQTIAAKTRQLKEQGVSIVDFGLGEPDFQTPDNIKLAAIHAIEQGFTKYTPIGGIPELKQAIIEKFKRDNSLSYEAKNITTAIGAKHILYTLFMTLCNPGDEVIIATPYWTSYPDHVTLAEGKPVFLKTHPENDYQFSLKDINRVTSPKTIGIIINSPCNPTGAVYSDKTLEALATWAEKENKFIISDEIYEPFVYDDAQHKSIASLAQENTIVINGVSKTYAMTGWRLGYCAAPAEIIAAMEKLLGQMTTHVTSITQKASIEALLGKQDSVQEMRTVFDERRKRITEGIVGTPGLQVKLPPGAFYLFPNCSRLYGKEYQGGRINNSADLANYLLSEVGVITTPGSAFGDDNHIRLSYATPLEAIEEGIRRIKTAIDKLS